MWQLNLDYHSMLCKASARLRRGLSRERGYDGMGVYEREYALAWGMFVGRGRLSRRRLWQWSLCQGRGVHGGEKGSVEADVCVGE